MQPGPVAQIGTQAGHSRSILPVAGEAGTATVEDGVARSAVGDEYERYVPERGNRRCAVGRVPRGPRSSHLARRSPHSRAARARCQPASRAARHRTPSARRGAMSRRALSSRRRDRASACRTKLPAELELSAACRASLNGEVLAAVRAKRHATSLRKPSTAVPTAARRNRARHCRASPASGDALTRGWRGVVLRGRWRRRAWRRGRGRHRAQSRARLRRCARWRSWRRWW